MSRPHELSARELGAAYRDGSLSPVEVARDVLDHIQRWEPHLQATWLLRPEAALDQARACSSAASGRSSQVARRCGSQRSMWSRTSRVASTGESEPSR